MSQCNHVDDKFGFKNIIDNSVVAGPYSVTRPSFKFFISLRARVLGKIKNGLFDI